MTADPFDDRCLKCGVPLDHEELHECEAFGDVVREHLVALAQGAGRLAVRTLKRLGLVE
jgi:hypothetical protein